MADSVTTTTTSVKFPELGERDVISILRWEREFKYQLGRWTALGKMDNINPILYLKRDLFDIIAARRDLIKQPLPSEIGDFSKEMLLMFVPTDAGEIAELISQVMIEVPTMKTATSFEDTTLCHNAWFLKIVENLKLKRSYIVRSYVTSLSRMAQLWNFARTIHAQDDEINVVDIMERVVMHAKSLDSSVSKGFLSWTAAITPRGSSSGVSQRGFEKR